MAEDLVVNAFVKLHETTNYSNIKSFLYTCVRNSCLNEIKRLKGPETLERKLTIHEELYSYDRFYWDNMKTIVILAQVDTDKAILIDVKKGNWWSESTFVENMENITEQEFNDLGLFGKEFTWKQVDPKDVFKE